MTINSSEKRTIMAVLNEVLCMPNVHSILGSITIEDAQKLYDRMRFEDYCTAHGIAYEDLTDEDRMQAYYEEYEY